MQDQLAAADEARKEAAVAAGAAAEAAAAGQRARLLQDERDAVQRCPFVVVAAL